MCDFTAEDKYWSKRIRTRRKRGFLGLFSFLPKIEVLSRSYVELACVQAVELAKEATGVQLNGCAALWVCSLTGVQPYGCAASWVCSLA
jgi:hypothetical protein